MYLTLWFLRNCQEFFLLRRQPNQSKGGPVLAAAAQLEVVAEGGQVVLAQRGEVGVDPRVMQELDRIHNQL